MTTITIMISITFILIALEINSLKLAKNLVDRFSLVLYNYKHNPLLYFYHYFYPLVFVMLPIYFFNTISMGMLLFIMVVMVLRYFELQTIHLIFREAKKREIADNQLFGNNLYELLLEIKQLKSNNTTTIKSQENIEEKEEFIFIKEFILFGFVIMDYFIIISSIQ